MNISALDTAIALYHEGLSLRPLAVDGRLMTLCSLSSAYLTRFFLRNSIADLNESILMLSEVLCHSPSGTLYATLCAKLSVSLLARHFWRGEELDCRFALEIILSSPELSLEE